MSKPDEIVQMLQDVEVMLGRLDIVINNADFGIRKSPNDLSFDEWVSVVNTNLRGTFVCSREAAKIMRTGGGGAIVNSSFSRAHMSDFVTGTHITIDGGMTRKMIYEE